MEWKNLFIGTQTWTGLKFIYKQTETQSAFLHPSLRGLSNKQDLWSVINIDQT
jgi:hypothetical protein